MTIPLPLHLFIHFTLAYLAGLAVGIRFKKVEIGIVAGILGGFLIDLDHLLEYFLFYGWHFNFQYFIEGREFVLSDQIHLWFHAWEYVPIILLFAYLVRRRQALAAFLAALALGGLIHLASDCLINDYSARNYSLIYRYWVDFSAPALLSPEQYQKYLESRVYFNL
jgi:hypothetical protein